MDAFTERLETGMLRIPLYHCWSSFLSKCVDFWSSSSCCGDSLDCLETTVSLLVVAGVFATAPGVGIGARRSLLTHLSNTPVAQRPDTAITVSNHGEEAEIQLGGSGLGRAEGGQDRGALFRW